MWLTGVTIVTVSASTHPTLLDVAEVNNADGTVASVIEMLATHNEMLMDMVVVESNEEMSHKTVIRTGLPVGVWRGYNQGVPPSKSQTATVRDEIGNYEMYAEVDRDLANLNGNSAAWRLQEERPFIEKMSQVVQSQLIYGSRQSEVNGFTGIMPRFSTVTAANAASADNVIDGGGSGTDNASILLVTWDPNTCHGIYPRGQSTGLMIEDKGQITIENADGSHGRMEAYRSHYKWTLGMTVRDWRYVVRIAIIDKSNLTADGATGAKLPDLMFEAMELLPSETMGRMAFYMARNVRTKLRQQLSERVSGSTLMMQDVGGVRTMMFQGVPIRRVDAMAADEAQVT